MKLKILLALLGFSTCVNAATLPPDMTVAADGSGDFKTVEQAVQSIPKDNHQRIVILLKDGVYKEKVRVDASNVTLRGQSRDGTRIEFSQINDDFAKNPDEFGAAVLNLRGDDFVLENCTVKNTAGVIGPHEFAVYSTGTRTVIIDCNVLSEGADTVSLWHPGGGMYYHARCNFRGSVDFVCPRGSCYITDSTFYEVKNTAAVWHDGSMNKEMKFVLHDCKLDGAAGWNLARHHHDAQFYFLDCMFSQTMTDRAPFRVVYPLNGSPPTPADTARNEGLNKSNQWGERAFYFNCHRDGGDFAWFKDNLPMPADQITAAWTFDGKWNPESKTGPTIQKIEPAANAVAVTFSEPVTVKGKPRLKLKDGSAADYQSGSGSATLVFNLPAGKNAETESVDVNGGAILASEADATIRQADVTVTRK